MLALRWHGRRDVRLEEVAEPVAGDGTLVAVTYCGICGTDLAEFRDGPLLMSGAPVTLGHEIVGRVVEGALEPGTRVAIDALLHCGHCDACRRGDVHRCRSLASVGLHADGGFAPLLAVPASALVPVPDHISDEAAAVTEPMAVALHALDRGGLAAGDTVVVLGFGPVGACAALLARALGARPSVVEVDGARAAAAARLGLDVLDPGDKVPRADVVVESTGVPAVLATAVEAAARGGRIVLIGIPKEPIPVDVRRLVLAEKSLVGSVGYRGDLPRVLELMSSGAIEPEALVGGTVPLSEAAATIEGLAAAPDPRIKVLVDCRG